MARSAAFITVLVMGLLAELKLVGTQYIPPQGGVNYNDQQQQQGYYQQQGNQQQQYAGYGGGPAPGSMDPIPVRTSGIPMASSGNELGAGMPHVCPYQEPSMIGHRRPCVKAYTRMVKVWRPNCGYSGQWCVGYERRTAYYTSYRLVYENSYVTRYKCCHGWSRFNGESGCMYRK
ncbi:multiple epidermal growth factor-like domains protein 6 [Patiria miniata]|uniref:EMI domain-containing protein n=1 Tax=Patiria miniata TaxID=46514 RepID=A0A914AEF6_PATMI|nr:multiple epidermal growth factor-like domains protein 6 [Patiria miniata]